MIRYLKSANAQQLQIDATGLGSVLSGGVYWIGDLIQVLEVVSLSISVVLGVYALWRIFWKKKDKPSE